MQIAGGFGMRTGGVFAMQTLGGFHANTQLLKANDCLVLIGGSTLISNQGQQPLHSGRRHELRWTPAKVCIGVLPKRASQSTVAGLILPIYEHIIGANGRRQTDKCFDQPDLRSSAVVVQAANIRIRKKINMSDRTIRAGDHLWVQRLGYEHHGLASGPRTVIQYSGKEGIFDTGVIEEVSLSTFAKDRKVRFKDHPQRLHNRTESVRRARQRIGEMKYNLVFNNCEHFVTWCIHDKRTSAQVNRGIRDAGQAATSMYLMQVAEKATRPIIPVSTQLFPVGRATSAALNAAISGQAAVSSVAPIASGMSAAGLTAVLGGAGATTVGIVSAPVSVPILAVAAGVGLTVAAVGALWDRIFD